MASYVDFDSMVEHFRTLAGSGAPLARKQPTYRVWQLTEIDDVELPNVVAEANSILELSIVLPKALIGGKCLDTLSPWEFYVDAGHFSDIMFTALGADGLYENVDDPRVVFSAAVAVLSV